MFTAIAWYAAFGIKIHERNKIAFFFSFTTMEIGVEANEFDGFA
jgi:hypothetical protein